MPLFFRVPRYKTNKKKKEKKRKRKKRERNEKKRRKSLYLQGNGNIDEVDKET